MTASPISRRQRNLTLECCKLAAACFVVFIHVPFPGIAGDYILCLSRFAVPLFFAISGWYSYRVSAAKLLKRMGHVLVLEAAGIFIMTLWGLFAAHYTGTEPQLLPTPPVLPDWTSWLIGLEDPFESHLWYLSAAAFCYGIFALLTALSGGRLPYRSCYLLGALLLCANFAMDLLCGFTGIAVSFKLPRTGLFLGLPMFLMGLFLREHRDALLGIKAPLLWLLPVLGVGLMSAEWLWLGSHGLYAGVLPTVSGILLLTSRYPAVPERQAPAAAFCGPLSTMIYLIHLTILDIYLGFGQWRLEAVLGSAEAWLRPLLILAVSAAIASCLLLPPLLLKKTRQKK